MYLYQTAVRGIQGWIIGTGRLKEIAGGSEIVEKLADLARDRAASVGVEESNVQAAAGRATIRFQTREQVESFARWWPMAVMSRAPGLPVVQAWSEGERWDELVRRLAEASARAQVDLPEAGPLVARSGRSGLPAVRQELDGTVDRGARARLDAYRGGRDRLAGRLLRDDRGAAFIDEVEDFPPGYVAVIHADANGVGRRFRDGEVKDPHAFSRALEEATRVAASRAVAVLPRRGDRVLARPIVLGGDDFTMLVPADDSLAFATEFLRTFEAETAARTAALGSKISACAGVAIVKPGWPFSAAHELAEELCKNAKASFRSANQSGLAFQRVTTALAGDSDELLSAPDPGSDPAGRRRLLTANPYRLDRLAQLDALAEAARAMPRGALRRWVDLTRVKLKHAQEHWDRLREVMAAREPERLRAFDAALKSLECEPLTGWHRDNLYTPVLDALEWRQVASRARSAGGR